MRILVTGGAGFTGHNFIKYLMKHTDWDVVSLDRLDEAGSLTKLAEIMAEWPGRLVTYWHDLRAAINPVHVPGPFDYVVHMAAGSHVDRSVRDPISFVQDNVIGTANLLEYCRSLTTLRKVLYFSTDEVFGPAPFGVSFMDCASHFANNPYAASKSAGEALCPAWAATFGVPVVVSHCTNIYGDGQYGEKFIPLVARKVLNGETVQIHAIKNPMEKVEHVGQWISSSRFYLHVDDVSSAVMTILEKGGLLGSSATGKYNIGGDTEFSNLEVAKKIAELLGKPLKWEFVDYVANRPKFDLRYDLDSRLLRSLGWKPQVPFEDGLRDVLEPFTDKCQK